LEKIKFRISSDERDLILDQILIMDDEIIEPVKICEISGDHFVVEYSIEDLENLLECVAAEANHAENRKMELKLDALYEKLNDIFESAVK